MAVYVWQNPEAYAQKSVGKYDEDTPPKSLLFHRGERLSTNPGIPIIRFRVPAERIKKLDNLVTTPGSPVVSPRLAEILTAFAPDDIQLFDVLLKAPSGDVEGYKLVNLTHTVEGVDRSRSLLKLSPGDDRIRGFKILPGCMDRLDEFHGHILVSQALRDHLKRSRFWGLNLYLLSAFSEPATT